jgi:hypothetical protein
MTWCLQQQTLLISARALMNELYCSSQFGTSSTKQGAKNKIQTFAVGVQLHTHSVSYNLYSVTQHLSPIYKLQLAGAASWCSWQKTKSQLWQ